MAAYTERLLELVSIIKTPNEIYLLIEFTYGKTKQRFKWYIDSFTCENLEALFLDEKKYKYRLSFYVGQDLFTGNYMSKLCRVHGEQTETIYFLCSKKYANELSLIKSSNNGVDIPCELVTEKKIVVDMEQKQTKNTFLVRAMLLVSVIFMGIFIFKSLSSPQHNELAAGNSFPEMTDYNVLNREVLLESSIISLSDDDVTETDVATKTFSSIIVENESIYGLSKDYVALTFDDGPSIYTKQIVDILLEYEIGATFFFIGKNIHSFSEEVAYAHKNGMAIGNHSLNHHVLSKLPSEKQEIELVTTNKLIEDITGEKVRLFRPPYGSYDQKLQDVMKNNDLKLVMWNRDTKDWQVNNASLIFNYVVDTESSGGIYLMHENQFTVEALPQLIEYLKGENLEIVVLR